MMMFFFGSKVINGLSDFKKISDIIVANRITPEIEDSVHKIYTRDLFYSD